MEEVVSACLPRSNSPPRLLKMVSQTPICLFGYDCSILKATSAVTIPLQNVPLKLERCWKGVHVAVAPLPLIWLCYRNPAQVGHLNCSHVFDCGVSNVSQECERSLFNIVLQQLQIKESAEKCIEVLIPLGQFSWLPFQCPLMFFFFSFFPITIVFRPKDCWCVVFP